MADISNLARKFGIVPGCSMLLIDAPATSAALLRDACPPGVLLAEDNDSDERYDLIFSGYRAPPTSPSDSPRSNGVSYPMARSG